MIATIIRRKSGKVIVVESGQHAPSGTVAGVMVEGSYYGEADPGILDAIRNRQTTSHWQQIREHLGLTRPELARAIGCTPQAVWQWEKLGHDPRASLRQKILALR